MSDRLFTCKILLRGKWCGSPLAWSTREKAQAEADGLIARGKQVRVVELPNGRTEAQRGQELPKKGEK